MRRFTNVAGGWSRTVMAGLLILVPGAAAADVSTISKVPFPRDVKPPLEISVGVVLVEFARINAREETFDIQGYLNLSWRVPSLAGQGNRRMFRDELWAPTLDFVNATEPVELQNEAAFHVSDDGLVEERVRFGGRFASPLNLRRFPFDTQHLEVHIEPFERTVDEVVFTVNPDRVGRYDSAFLSDWDISGVRASCAANHHMSLDQTRSRFTFFIEVQRRSTFYVWRVVLPLILLVAVSWGAFWVDAAQLQPQISTAISVLLSIVVFNMTIDFAQPKVAYFTFIDTHALMSYHFMGMSIATIFLIHHRLNTRGLDAARALQRRARVFFPTTYLIAFLVEAVSYFA